MSEKGDQVRAALSSEWRSTIEIAGGVEASKGVIPYAHLRTVYKHLLKAVKEGTAEE